MASTLGDTPPGLGSRSLRAIAGSDVDTSRNSVKARGLGNVGGDATELDRCSCLTVFRTGVERRFGSDGRRLASTTRASNDGIRRPAQTWIARRASAPRV